MNKSICGLISFSLLMCDVQAMFQNSIDNGLSSETSIIVQPSATLTIDCTNNELDTYQIKIPTLIWGNANNVATLEATVPISIVGTISETNGIPLLFSAENNTNVSFNDTLTLKDMALELKTEAGYKDPKLWHRPVFTVAKKLSLVGVIGFEAELINSITIEPGKHTIETPIFDVSKLEHTVMKFEKNWDYIIISGKSEKEPAVINYYNPEDADGISDISKINDIKTISKDIYIENIRGRLKRLFFGGRALLKGLQFENMKIYNYFDVITPDISNAITNFDGITIEPFCQSVNAE